MMRLIIIGLGNQAKAWAQNLRDSGFPVAVALKTQSPSFSVAQSLGLNAIEIGSMEFYQEKAFALLTPDSSHKDFILEYGPKLKKGSVMLYAHGFSLIENDLHQKVKNLEHVLFAPKSIGTELRRQFELKGKLGAVYSLEHVNSDKKEIESWLLDLARALGINMGPYKTSFERETKADLFSEQGLLCSLIPYGADLMFRNLVESGVEPELAYFECWYELKLIINAMIDKGPRDFFDLISPNALIGSEKGFQRLMNKDFNQNMKSLLEEIEDGTFNKEIETTSVEKTRELIRERWNQSPLQKTFEKINQANS